MASSEDGVRLVVMQSFRPPRRSTNPFLVELHRSIAPLSDVQYFTWRRALLGRLDVLHLHWPELLLRGRTRPRTAVRRLLFAAMLVRIRLRHRAIVRTLHNLEPHERGSRIERALLALCDRWTTIWIRLVPYGEPQSTAPVVTIPHGHFHDWYAAYDVPEPVPGRLLYFGLIRRYKGVAELVDVVQHTDDPALSLRVVGRPDDQELCDAVLGACEDDPRITAALHYVDDRALAHEVGEAELVLLPFREMYNSGSVLLALSLSRPVLVPSSPITADLSAEVGPGWVHTYTPPLTVDALCKTLVAVRSTSRSSKPELVARDWDRIGAQHVAAYREASERARRRS
jgi:beta-1,4-mannosyltransferase